MSDNQLRQILTMGARPASRGLDAILSGAIPSLLHFGDILA